MFTDLWGIIESIPYVWKRWLRDDLGGKQFKNWYLGYKKHQKVANLCYKNLNSEEDLLLKALRKWDNMGWEISLDLWLKYINRTYVITNVAKFRSFQYKLLCKAITMNKHLKHYGLRDNKRCTFCDIFEEDLLHLFVDCTCIKYFWEQVGNWMPILKNLDSRKIICNTPLDNPKLLPNLIVLLAKIYIYRVRCNKSHLNFQQFLEWVYEIRKIEQIIAYKNNSILKHELKWSYI